MIRYSVEKLMSQMMPTQMAQDVLYCSGPLAHLQFYIFAPHGLRPCRVPGPPPSPGHQTWPHWRRARLLLRADSEAV